MTKRAKRLCKKIMGKGISRNAARLLIDELQMMEGIRTVHNDDIGKLLARLAALKAEDMRFVNGAVEYYVEMRIGVRAVTPETGEADG